MTKKRLTRVLTVLATVALLVFVGRLEAVAVALFAASLFLGFIPGIVLLVLTAVAASLVLKVFRHSKLIMSAFLALLISQAAVLFVWFEGWTAASAFWKRHFEAGLPVIDPQLEQKVMIGFWLLAAFVVALTLERLINSFLSREADLFGKHSRKAQIGVLLFEVFLLLSLSSSRVNFTRMSRDVNVPASVSPDGRKEIQLVPMNAWIDTNGLVIVRRPGSLVWRTVGEIGDSLTEASGGRFAWSGDGSKVYLLLDFYREKDFPMLGYDFETNKQIDPKTYLE